MTDRQTAGETSAPEQTPVPSGFLPEVKAKQSVPDSLTGFSVRSVSIDPLSAVTPLVFECAYECTLDPGSISLEFVLEISASEGQSVNLSAVLAYPEETVVFKDLSALALDTSYTWKLSIPDSSFDLSATGTFVISSADLQGFMNDRNKHIRGLVFKGLHMGPEAAIVPRMAVFGGQNPPAAYFESLVSDSAGSSGTPGFRLRTPELEGPSKNTWLEARYSLPCGIKSSWIPVCELVNAASAADIPLWPGEAAALIGMNWYFFWPALPGPDVQFVARYRQRGKPEEALRRVVQSSGILLGPDDLTLVKGLNLEYFAWKLDLGDLGETPEIVHTRFLAFNEPVPIFKPGSTISFPVGRDSGAPDERPKRTVTLSRAFALVKEPITNALGAELLNRLLALGMVDITVNPSSKPPSVMLQDVYKHKLAAFGLLDSGLQSGLLWLESAKKGRQIQVFSSKENHPLVGVSWWGSLYLCNIMSLAMGMEPAYDCFAGRLTVPDTGAFRLPLELEWEAVASTGLGWASPWGNRVDQETANFDRSRDPFEDLSPPYMAKGGPTVPVQYYRDRRFARAARAGSPRANFLMTDFLAMDMVGNVWEWCQDWYHQNRYANMEPVVDGEAPEFSAEDIKKLKVQGLRPSRTVRGGAWNSRLEDLYAQNRGSFVPDSSSQSIGFRFARSVLP